MKWVITLSRHHNVPVEDFYFNVTADTEEKAILEAYRIGIRHFFHDDINIPDISAILEEKELHIEIIDLEDDTDDDVVMWNQLSPENKIPNRGMGLGSSIDETYKSENIWIKVEKRNSDNVWKAILAYKHQLEDLDLATQIEILQILEGSKPPIPIDGDLEP